MAPGSVRAPEEDARTIRLLPEDVRARSCLQRTCSALTVNGVRHSILTLTTTAMGGGVLAMSYMMRINGLALGLASLLVAAVIAALSITVLMEMTALTRKDSFASLFAHCAGPMAGPVLDFMLFLYGNGACVGYLVFLSDFIPALVTSVAPHCAPVLQGREVAITASALLLLPLVLQKDVSALRCIAPISIISLIYMAVVIGAQTPSTFHRNHGPASGGRLELANFGLQFPEAFTLCTFAFNCHLNVIPVADSMIRATKARICKVSLRANLIEFVFYAFIGVCGYLSFLGNTDQDIIKNYAIDNKAVIGGRFMLSCTMMVAIPMNFVPTMKSGLQLIEYFRGPELPQHGGAAARPRGNEAARIVLTLLCLPVQAFLAVKVPGVADVLNILGATVATAMMLVIPAYCMGKVLPPSRSRNIQMTVFYIAALINLSSLPLKLLRSKSAVH